MNHNMIRCVLYSTAFAAPMWAFVAVWWHLGAAVTLVIAGAVALIAAGYIDRQEEW